MLWCTGSTGPTGPTGPTGAIGPTGPLGPVFPPVVLGNTGSTAGTDPSVNVSNDGQEWVDPVTGARYISNGIIWQLAPCCTDITNNSDSTVNISMDGNTGVNVVKAPTGMTGNFVLVGGPTGYNWEPETFAINYLGATGATNPNGSTNPSDFPNPVNGDQYYNQLTGESWIYNGSIWEEVPCCTTITQNSDSTVNISMNGNTGINVVSAPTGITGNFVLVGGPTGYNWEPETFAINYLGATGATNPNGSTNPSDFPNPVNGDQYYNQLTGESWIYNGSIWEEVPCCTTITKNSDSTVNISMNGNTGINVVSAPTGITGNFVLVGGPTGYNWEPETFAINYLGATGATNPNGSTNPSDFPNPVNGDQYYNQLTGESWIYNGSIWEEVPCCTTITKNSDSTVNISMNGNTGINVVSAPTGITGNFVLVGGPTGYNWEPETFAINYLGATGATNPNGSTNPSDFPNPVNGDQYYNQLTGESWIYNGSIWEEVPCCTTITKNSDSTVNISMNGNTGINVVSAPTGITGNFVLVGGPTGYNWEPETFAINYLGATGATNPNGSTNPSDFPNPVNGDQYYNQLTGESWIYNGSIWEEVPCCTTITKNSDSTVNISMNGNTGINIVSAPTGITGNFVLVGGPTGYNWEPETFAINYVGATGATNPNGSTNPSDFPNPVNGDQYYNQLTGESWIYNGTIWQEIPAGVDWCYRSCRSYRSYRRYRTNWSYRSNRINRSYRAAGVTGVTGVQELQESRSTGQLEFQQDQQDQTAATS